MGSFTFADGVVGVVLVVSAGMAFLRGFVHEVLAIGAWIGAAAATLYGFDYAQPWFAAQIGVAWAANLLTGLSLFLTTLLTLSLVTKAISNQVRQSALNSVDTSLGFVFGLLRGALILSAAYYIAVEWAFDPGEQPTWLATAKTRPWLERGAAEIRKFRPHNLGTEETVAAPVIPASGDLEEDSKRGEDQLGTGGKATVQTLAAPKPSAPSQPAEQSAKTKGYDKDERREMDRLFHNTQ